MMLQSHRPTANIMSMERSQAVDSQPTRIARRPKRKAEPTDNNERLSKRLSLLNLEQNGTKLYVPVENPKIPSPSSPASAAAPSKTIPQSDDSMQLDDSKYKVYIYNMDDELSSESEPEDGKLVFLPDIDKHLRNNRIPPGILPNKDGELAGMQLVVYNDPSSLTVPKDQDNVRRAIIDARARVRTKQKEEREGPTTIKPVISASPRLSTDFRASGRAESTHVPSAVEAWGREDDSDAMDLD